MNKNKPTKATPEPKAVSTTKEEYRPSAINLKRSDWRLLRRVADARADKRGFGRRSVSAVIESLIEQARTKLEAEIEH